MEDKPIFECNICPRRCKLKLGQFGFCGTRLAHDDGIYFEGYSRISTMVVEPIEKRSFYHFKPGTKALSIGGYGCNLNCDICNNWSLSHKRDPSGCKYFSPSAIVHLAISRGCSTVCMDYTEPIVYYEFLIDLANKCHDRGVYFAINTNAYASENIWEDILDVTDALNIDWKGRSKLYYERCKADKSKPVSVNDKIERSLKNGNHVEISIPVYWNSFEFDINNLLSLDIFVGLTSNIPVHVLKMLSIDENEDREASDDCVFSIAKRLMNNFNFVYVHNIFNKKAENMRRTMCPDCGLVIATREPFKLEKREGCKCDKHQEIFR